MASGRAHATASLALALPCGIAAYAATSETDAGIAVATGLILSVAINPDLDITALTYSEARIVRRLWLFGWLWVLYWLPYAHLVNHRARLSHLPILGTLGRVVYMLAPLWPALAAAGRGRAGRLGFWAGFPVHTVGVLALWVAILRFDVPDWNPNALWGLFVGLMVGDIGHWLLDGLPHMPLPFSPRSRRRRRSTMWSLIRAGLRLTKYALFGGKSRSRRR